MDSTKDSDLTGWWSFAPSAKDTLYKIDKIVKQTKTLLEETEKLRATIKNVVFTYNDAGQIIKETWITDDGIIHRPGGAPAIITGLLLRKKRRVLLRKWNTSAKLSKMSSLLSTKTDKLRQNHGLKA
ncbi:hypothetical protein A3B64_00470 [candidate division WWE3 bacterium RIFCSPLOWO2_01_FULL_37_24]|nr:MAG: hypothetical protein A3B64_00470 [candidate division WWE3 bacterium RIFCSPLOWO2_01_FULL_37_24]